MTLIRWDISHLSNAPQALPLRTGDQMLGTSILQHFVMPLGETRGLDPRFGVEQRFRMAQM